jgi:hypothetical protein
MRHARVCPQSVVPAPHAPGAMALMPAPGILALLLLAALFLPACTDGGRARQDKLRAEQTARAKVVRTLAYWKDALAIPLDARIGPAPAPLIEFLELDNIEQGYADKPRAPALTDDFMRDVRAALAGLPEQVRRPLAKKLVGIYLVDAMGSSGWSEEVLDADGRAVAGVIVLDAGVLAAQTANAWATWKENTPFKPRAGYRLEARIEDAAQDNRVQAIQFILLHEMGHVLAMGGDLHPSPNAAPKDLPANPPYPFFNLAWSVNRDGKYASRFDAAFTQRREVVYYLGAKLDAAQMPAVYTALDATSFATLYGATNPFDDFAEAYVTYVHTVLMGRPYAVRLYVGDTLQKTYAACWEEPRCAAKRRIIEALLRAP